MQLSQLATPKTHGITKEKFFRKFMADSVWNNFAPGAKNIKLALSLQISQRGEAATKIFFKKQEVDREWYTWTEPLINTVALARWKDALSTGKLFHFNSLSTAAASLQAVEMAHGSHRSSSPG